MGDMKAGGPDHSCLFHAASEQHGYFTTPQARSCGFNAFILSHHANSGRFVRVRRGLYRLRDYPSWYREDVVAAWLAVGKDAAVVSHASALDLLDLSDVIPNTVHLTVPRSKRHLPALPGVSIHTTSRPFPPADLTIRDGIRLTSPVRTILDSAATGEQPEQIEMAIAQGIERGQVTAHQLRQGATQRGQRVAQLVENALRDADR